MKYANRQHAGQILAESLLEFKNQPDVLILALPRGGVPVAYEIAQQLNVPLDICVVRKLGLPSHEEYAMGAIAADNVLVFNEEIITSLHIKSKTLDDIIAAEERELQRRELLYRGNKPYPVLLEKTVILVDDGIATGFTMRAALAFVQKHVAKTIIIAIPAAARSTCDEMATLVDRLICPLQPVNFYAVGLWYDDFQQTSDAEVIALLHDRPNVTEPSS